MTTLMHRKILKWLHWLSAAIMIYFIAVEPYIPELASPAAKTAALATHAGMGAVLGLLVLVWTSIFALKGQASKPGPKLKGWARSAHTFVNRGLYYAMPVMMLTGLSAGLAAPFLVMGFGLFPMNFGGMSSDQLHDVAQEIHEIAFNGLLLLLIVHVAFHLWRHFGLKDNALRMMVPVRLHKYL